MFVFTHRNPEMQLDKSRTALVLADIQNEFLDEKIGKYYPLIEEALKKRNVVANLEKLLSTAQKPGPCRVGTRSIAPQRSCGRILSISSQAECPSSQHHPKFAELEDWGDRDFKLCEARKLIALPGGSPSR